MELPKWSNSVSQHLLKVEDGKSVIGTFRGDVHRYYEHWVNNRSALCTRNNGSCQACQSEDEAARKARGRFRINFIMKDPTTGEPVAKILEGGKKLYEQLEAINKECPIDSVWVKISRSGTRQNTQWFVNVVPGEKGMLTSEQKSKVLGVELHDVVGEDKQEEEVPTVEREAASSGEDEDIPF